MSGLTRKWKWKRQCIFSLILSPAISSCSFYRESTQLVKSFLANTLLLKGEWSLGAYWLIAAGAYPGFYSMKWLGVFLLPLDGMVVHRRSLPCNLLGFLNNLLVPIYTPEWREALWEWGVFPKNTTQCFRPGLEPGPLDPGRSTLTMRPPCLHASKDS